MSERKWQSIVANRAFKGYDLSAAISKVVMRLVRHRDQGEGDHDGEVYWYTMSKIIDGHVAVPYIWKEFVFHRCCSYNADSILGTCRSKGKQGRKTNHLLHTSHLFCRHLTRDFFSTHLTLCTPTLWLKVLLVRIHPICMSSMMSRELSLSLPRFHSPSLLTSSSFLPTSTSLATLPDNNTTATITRNEDRCSLATITLLTGYETNVSNNFDETNVATSIFQNSSRSYLELGDNCTTDAEIDDEHIMIPLRELIRQNESQRVEIGSFIGYEQYRREQDPLHEELKFVSKLFMKWKK